MTYILSLFSVSFFLIHLNVCFSSPPHDALDPGQPLTSCQEDPRTPSAQRSISTLTTHLAPIVDIIQPCPHDTLNVSILLTQQDSIVQNASHAIPRQQLLTIELLKSIEKYIVDFPKCIKGDDLVDALDFTESLHQSNWLHWTHDDVIHLLFKLKENQAQWRNEASKNNSTVYKTIPIGSETAEFIILPNREIIINLKNQQIGYGGEKSVKTTLKIAADERIRSGINSVQLTSLDNEDPVIEREWEIYKIINARNSTRKDVVGLATASLIQLSDQRKALIQDRFSKSLDRSLRSLTLPERNSIFRQVATGLKIFHEEGLVHSDIKPENILLDDKGRAVISDFGIANNPTLNISPRATPGFDAPEMFDKSSPNRLPSNATQSAIAKIQKRDIYALGLVLVGSIQPNREEHLYTKCRALAQWGLDPPGYNRQESAYGKCIQKEAKLLHNEMKTLALNRCTPVGMHLVRKALGAIIGLSKNESEHCFEAIAADCLDPDPDKRPTADSIARRLNKVAIQPH